MKASAEDCLTLAKTIWGEARSESYLGQCEIAWVVLNRINSGRWFGGKTITATCLMPEQFTCWNVDDPNRMKLDGLTLDDPYFQVAMNAALSVITGVAIPTGTKETHYYRTGTQLPKWAIGKTRSFKIGNHEFFGDIP